MLAYGYAGSGKSVMLTGQTTAELEAAAGREHCLSYWYPVDGGYESVRLIAGEWVRQ